MPITDLTVHYSFSCLYLFDSFFLAKSVYMYTSGTNLFSQPLAASTMRLEMEGDTRELYL